MSSAFIAGLAMGMAAAPHCAAMCGSLGALACQGRGGALRSGLRHQLGKSLSYAGLGALFGYGGGSIASWLRSGWTTTLMSWTFALGLGWAAWRLWQPAIAVAEGRLLPASSLLRGATGTGSGPTLMLGRFGTFLLGIASGLLPCGALGMLWIAGAATASPAHGAALGLGFATTAGLSALGAGSLTRVERIFRLRAFGRLVAVALALGAIIFILRPLPFLAAGSAEGWPAHAARSLSAWLPLVPADCGTH